MVFNVLATINVFPTTVTSVVYDTFTKFINIGYSNATLSDANLGGYQATGGGQTCAISDNGLYIIFVGGYSGVNRYIYTSSDGGSTWATKYDMGTNNSVQGACMSSDGNYQYAISYYASNASYFFKNTNPTTPSWSSYSTGFTGLRGITCSSSGQYVALTGSTFYYSTNYGTSGSFTTSTFPVSTVYSAAIADDSGGDTVYIAGLGSTNAIIYKTTNAKLGASATFDSRVTITNSNIGVGAQQLSNIVCSASGKYILCGTVNGTGTTAWFWFSDDSGLTFKKSNDASMNIIFTTSTIANRTRVGISKTGQYMIVTCSNTTLNVYCYSTDYGVTWTLVPYTSTNFNIGPTNNSGVYSSVYWNGIALNTSGSRCLFYSSETTNTKSKFFLATATNI